MAINYCLYYKIPEFEYHIQGLICQLRLIVQWLLNLDLIVMIVVVLLLD